MVYPWGRDEEYVGVTPGLIPPPGTAQVRKVKGREWKGTVAVQFHPPAGVSPALAGTVIDGVVDPGDLGAMMIDLSLRGWFQIRKDDKDWVFTRPVDPPTEPLTPAEQAMLGGIFRGRHHVRLSELKPTLAGPLRQARDGLYTEVVERGWYRRHPNPSGAERMLGRSPRTADGTAVRIQTLGFRKYIATAEAGQIKVEEAAGLFSRYLPYAMIFGLADEWAGVVGKVFRDAGITDLTQIAGNIAFDPFMWIFADDLINLGGSALLGLTDLLGDSGGLLDLGGMTDMVGDVFSSLGDAFGDVGDFFDF